jgi:hypothetical protein
MSSVWTFGTVIFGAVLVFAACSRRRADDADHTRFRPPTELHAVSITDAGIAVDPHARTVTADEAAGSEYMCSTCFKVVSQAHIHVIPWFNDSEGDYVTTFRCDDDWLSSLDETRAHFLAGVEHPQDRAKFVAFFERHQLSGLDASDAAALRRDGLALLDKIRAKQIVLPP